MEREELIKNLRFCADAGCGFDARGCSSCVRPHDEDCTEFLMRAAANMLEADLHESKSEKTADEMFRELGYVQKQRNDHVATYRSDLHQIVLRYNLAEKFAEKRMVGYYWEACNLTLSEIRAVCKLLDEERVE